MNIHGFELGNQDKLVRAAEGSATSDGGLSGGVGYDDQDLLLATYDKLGGLITKNGLKVKTGSFFDFKANAPKSEPEVIFLVKVADEFVEVPEGEAMPIEVEAQKILDAKKASKVAKKTSSSKVKAKKASKEVEE